MIYTSVHTSFRWPGRHFDAQRWILAMARASFIPALVLTPAFVLRPPSRPPGRLSRQFDKRVVGYAGQNDSTGFSSGALIEGSKRGLGDEKILYYWIVGRSNVERVKCGGNFLQGDQGAGRQHQERHALRGSCGYRRLRRYSHDVGARFGHAMAGEIQLVR